jgi:hypothetical protein
MNALFSDIGMAWRFGTKPRDRLFTHIGAVLVALTGTGGALYAWLDNGPLPVIRYCLAAVLTLLLIVYWSGIATAAVALNTPYAAWCAPSSRDRLVRVLLVTGAAAVVLIALALGYGNSRIWLMGLGAACAFAGIVLSRTGRKFIGLVMIEVPIIGTAVMFSAPVKRFLAPYSDVQVALVLAIAVFAVLRWTVRITFPRGERSSAAQETAAKARRNPGAAQYEPRFILWLMHVPYQAVQRFNLRGRTPGAGMQLVLGPTAHWTTSAGYAFAILAACVALKLAGRAIGADDFVTGFGTSLFGLLVGTYLFQLRRYSLRIGATRTEQALARLTAAAPVQADFNRRFGGALLASALLDWLFLAAAALLLVLLFSDNPHALPPQTMFAVWIGLLPLTALTLHDYGAAGPDTPGRQTLMATGVAVALGIPTALLVQVAGWPFWVALTVCSAILTPALIYLRYQRMASAPIAFPAAHA